MASIPADILKARTKELVIDRKRQFMQHAALEMLKISDYPTHESSIELAAAAARVLYDAVERELYP